jgi:hypothetical protein
MKILLVQPNNGIQLTCQALRQDTKKSLLALVLQPGNRPYAATWRAGTKRFFAFHRQSAYWHSSWACKEADEGEDVTGLVEVLPLDVPTTRDSLVRGLSAYAVKAG